MPCLSMAIPDKNGLRYHDNKSVCLFCAQALLK